ncbi:MAG: alpha/beta fold hydrolase [Pseudomonadota bacterium]
MQLNAIRQGMRGALPPLLIAHGLFGAARNWSGLAKRLSATREVVAVDLRNHGDSGWDATHDYPAMASDLADTLATLGGTADVLGHSMGGKAAMLLALTRPETVRRLVVVDIAPVGYAHSQRPYLEAMRGLDLGQVTRRSLADKALAAAVPDAGVRAFLAQNLVFSPAGARWRLNLEALDANLDAILGWPEVTTRFEGPVTVIYGTASEYVRPEHHAAIHARFPAARFEGIEGAGHWVHAEAPDAFLAALSRALA